MKKWTLSLAVVAGLMLLASCQKPQTFSLKGENLPEELNGKYVYLLQGQYSKDSVLVQNGSFEYKTDSLDTQSVSYLFSREAQIYVPVIKENGAFTLQKDEEGNNYSIVAQTADDKSLNTALRKYVEELETTMKPIAEDYRTKYQKLSEEGLSKDSVELLQKELESVKKDYIAKYNEIAKKYYDLHKDDAVGVKAFSDMQFENDRDFIAAFDEASEAVKNNKELKANYDKLMTAVETGEGKPYKGDYEITDETGKTMKLSDYMEEGKYLLVDFWASWCGPCRAAMPHLATIVKEHAKTINVLSVGVWEKDPENNLKAREELKMTWNVFLDKDSKSADVYGISGIPTLLLINPEGVIVYRGHDPEEVDVMIKDLGL